MIYLIGSMRNPRIPIIAEMLRGATGQEVFDDWYSPGKDADDEWQRYEQLRGRKYLEALQGEHAKTVFHFDYKHLNRCDMGVLVLPAGKSGHLELGYLIGQGKPGYILMESEPERYDIMYRFATVCMGVDELIESLPMEVPF